MIMVEHQLEEFWDEEQAFEQRLKWRQMRQPVYEPKVCIPATVSCDSDSENSQVDQGCLNRNLIIPKVEENNQPTLIEAIAEKDAVG
jgi:hypothetical protein